jgi:hypothetical protein
MSDETDEHKTNKETLASLARLAAVLKDLDDKSPSGQLSHWRLPPAPKKRQENDGSDNNVDDIHSQTDTATPREVHDGYQLLTDGASLISATSTKYTLVSKISLSDSTKLAAELLQGCQLLTTGALILHSPAAGCARSTRHYVKRAARAVVATVTNLIAAFVSGEVAEENHEQLAAQKCGSVWSACDTIVGGKNASGEIIRNVIPKGNRNAMRRDLLVLGGECNETYEEFSEVIELGAMDADEEEERANGDDVAGVGGWDEFGGAAGHQYTAKELPLAHATLALIKCSRGSINATLKACECAGDEAEKNGVEDEIAALRRKAVLCWIGKLHDMARIVGEGVTDVGCMLYPPLTSKASDLMDQVENQKDVILSLTELILDATPNMGAGEGAESAAATSQSIIPMSDEVTELASKLRSACKKRYDEAKEAAKA